MTRAPTTPSGSVTPVQDASASAATGARAPTNDALRDVRVLIVDDDIDSREFLAAALQSLGAKALQAGGAQDALEALTNGHPDILLSDIAMPGRDGYSLMRQIRRLPSVEGGRIPAAAVTAFCGSRDRERAFDAGFQLHLVKPVTLNALRCAALELVRMKGDRSSSER